MVFSVRPLAPIIVQPVISGFSDTDWPSPTNRPTLAGSILSWIGPSGGGPNNGNPIQQHLTLSASGGITTSANGQTISGQQVTGTINVGHNNVTIKQCSVLTNNTNDTAINITAAITGLIVEDCLLNGSKNSLEGIYPNVGSLGGATRNIIRRNFITGFENGITFDNSSDTNIDITDNYFTAGGNSGAGAPHIDLIELYGVTNILVQHNQFDAINSQTPGLTSAINIVNQNAPVTATINNNLFSNNNVYDNTVITDGPDFGTGFTVSFSFTNNGFYINALFGPGHGIPGTNYTLSPNSGNYVAATQTATSGVPISGSGTSGSGQLA